MYIYWRIQQDLNCLGETIHFHEPCFIRSMQRLARQNRAGLALTDDLPVDLLHAAIEDSANNTEASMALMTQPYDGPLQ